MSNDNAEQKKREGEQKIEQDHHSLDYVEGAEGISFKSDSTF